MERNPREFGCQMNYNHLSHNHINHSHICSQNLFSSMIAPEYNHWLSSMVYGSDVYAHSPYEHCIPPQCLGYDNFCAHSFQHGSIAHDRRSPCDSTDEELSPNSHTFNSASCSQGHFSGDLRPRFGACHPGKGDMCSDAYMLELYGMNNQRNMRQSHNGLPITYCRQKSPTSFSSLSRARHHEYGGQLSTEQDYDQENNDIDHLNYYSDQSITVTLCGLEEVLTRLI
eukprot:Seg2001.3 transcript_id=Seg2001.3/GoldUCD/mRNA.D3Y31 product="hypothetical protein" protein_id=Seg2001.3/GoldUCD/D3Y31